MEKCYLFFLITLYYLLFVSLGGSATSIPEIYWKVNLPNTPMPQFIKRQLVPPSGLAGPPCRKVSISTANRRYLFDDKQEIGSNNPNCAQGLESKKGYNGLWSYDKKGLGSTNIYAGMLSYGIQGLKSTEDYNGYLSYKNTKGLASTDYANKELSSQAGYDGLLSYGNKGLSSQSGYDGLLSYGSKGLASQSAYNGLLSYGSKGLSSQSAYDGLLSYGNKGLASQAGYDGLLSYGSKGLASQATYDGLLSYGSKGLASQTSYDGLLSYDNKELASQSGYDGLLSYGSKKLASQASYDGLLSYGSKGLASQSGYDSLLSYNNEGKESLSTHEDANIKAHEHVFFVKEDMHIEKKLSLHFQKSTLTGIFLPRKVSNSIPFSSDKVQETLRILSIDPKSHEAYVLSKRIELCEEPTIEGVEKKCVTSLESMVDYVISLIGTNVDALTTELEKDYTKMEYTIKMFKKLAKNDRETVVCHKMGYPYAVYFCHRTMTIRSYMVNLQGADGTEIKAVAACHKETNDFLEKYAKDVLKIVPGSTHICHFPAAEDTIIWVRK